MQTPNLELHTIMQKWRDDIPLLNKRKQSQANAQSTTWPFIYLDSAATALKPQPVIDSIVEYYSEYPANIHRGSYPISIRASEEYEEARNSIKQFVSANDDYELIFTSGMTSASNFIAQAHALMNLDKPEILITSMEHHSLYLPWLELCKHLQVAPRFIPITSGGILDTNMLEQTLANISKQPDKANGAKSSKQCKILAITGMSNVTGYVPPLAEIYTLCNKAGVKMIVDAAQLAAHKEIDLAQTPFDALICSAHKMGGPTGIGMLCIKKEWLNTFPQVLSGGGTVETVSQQKQVYLTGPERFEAGTPHIAGVIGFAAAVRYLKNITWQRLQEHEHLLRKELITSVKKLKDVQILGDLDAADSAIVSFVSPSLHAQDIGFVLEQKNICVRNGTMCAQPLISELNAKQITRVSAYGYNSIEDIQRLGDALESCLV